MQDIRMQERMILERDRRMRRMGDKTDAGRKGAGSVSGPYSLNPDPTKNLNPDPVPDPSYFLTLSEIFFLHNFIITRFSHKKSQLKDGLL